VRNRFLDELGPDVGKTGNCVEVIRQRHPILFLTTYSKQVSKLVS